MIRVTGPGLPSSGANYEYLVDSDLIQRIKFKQGTTVKARVIRSYESDRDLLAFLACYGGSPPSSMECLCADLNADDLIDLRDLAGLLALFGTRSACTPPECWPCPDGG